MKTNRDLNYRLYVQKMNGFTRTAYQSEFEKYITVQSGDVEQVRLNFAAARTDFMAGKGQLSLHPVRNLIYHFVVSVSLTSRICIEGGMSHDTAYTLADIYILKADQCTSCDAVIDLFEEMLVDYAERMREIKKLSAISIHIRKCIDYIYENLHQNLSVKELALREHLNPSYLSKLFIKETGVTIKEFVSRAKINTAENMLRHSDFSFLDISLALGFSSQSAFISVFKKYTGLTPKQYRDRNYRSEISGYSK